MADSRSRALLAGTIFVLTLVCVQASGAAARTVPVSPLDRGTAQVPGGWRSDQWNMLGRPGGIRIEPAWTRLADRAPGGDAVTIAIVDSGIAYMPTERGPAAPDFGEGRFVGGTDLVDGDDRPLDENGHGTHIAAIVGEQVTLEQPAPEDDFLTGIAYGVDLMPLRVLDHEGAGRASDVAAAIRWAARHGAEIINVSLQFGSEIESCAQVPSVCKATRAARRRGSLVVASAGNAVDGGGRRGALYPGAAPGVLAVGATTEHGCIAAYSNYGGGVDLVGPGGGPPRPDATRPECGADQRPVLGLTYACFPDCGPESPAEYAIRADTGTSIAAAHASGIAALVIASRVVGRSPTPRQLARRLSCTARNARPKRFYRAGILDAARAVDPKARCGR